MQSERNSSSLTLPFSVVRHKCRETNVRCKPGMKARFISYRPILLSCVSVTNTCQIKSCQKATFTAWHFYPTRFLSRYRSLSRNNAECDGKSSFATAESSVHRPNFKRPQNETKNRPGMAPVNFSWFALRRASPNVGINPGRAILSRRGVSVQSFENYNAKWIRDTALAEGLRNNNSARAFSARGMYL